MLYRFYFTVIMMCCFCHPSKANSKDIYTDLSFSLVTDSLLLTPDNSKVSPYFTPEISLAIGADNFISENWSLETKLGVTYSHFDVVELNAGENKKGNNLGLWLSNILYFKGLGENTEPFLGISAGRIRSNFDGELSDLNQWETGRKVVTGLRFNLNEKSKLSIAFGSSGL